MSEQSILTEILNKFQEICDDVSVTDGWEGFSTMWEFVGSKATQHSVHPTAAGGLAAGEVEHSGGK